jgi:serine/threonine protein kinase
MTISDIDSKNPFYNLTDSDIPLCKEIELPLKHSKVRKLVLLERNGYRGVLKDYRNCGFFYSFFLGPFLVNREIRVCNSLKDIPGIPKICTRIDRSAFISEYFDGKPANRVHSSEISEHFFMDLSKLVQKIHDHGWVHGDLKAASNIIVLPGNKAAIVDFQTAFSRNGSFRFVRQFLFNQFVLFDRLGILKLKKKLRPDLLTQEEKDMLSRKTFLMRISQTYRWLIRKLIKRYRLSDF